MAGANPRYDRTAFLGTERAAMHIQRDQFLALFDRDLKGDTELHEKVYYTVTRPKFQALVETMAGLPEPKTVLEIGTSRFSTQLKRLCPHWEVHTLDLTDTHQVLAEAADLQFHCCNILSPLKCPPNYFDLIIFSEVIEHLQGNPRLALRHLRDCLAPGGRLLLTTPNLARLLNRVKLILGRAPVPEIGNPEWWGGHMREYTFGEISNMLGYEGYLIESGGPHLYWDGIAFYMNSGPFDRNAQTGKLEFHRRFGGWKAPVGLVYAFLTNRIASWVPSLRHGMLVVAQRKD